jgi:hypothetical protein
MQLADAISFARAFCMWCRKWGRNAALPSWVWLPYNPKVVRSGHGARHVHVVVSRFLSRVVLYCDSTVRVAPTTDVAEIASGG